MITLIMDCATVLAAILHATGHATETWGGTVSLWDAKFTNILELINFCFLFVFMLHIVNYKWLSLIMSTTAREHGLLRSHYSAAFFGAAYVPVILGHHLWVDQGTAVKLQLFAMCTYWTVFYRKEQEVRMWEEERDKWHEQLRQMRITLAEYERDMRRDPTPARERGTRAALVAFRTAKARIKEKERLLFRGGYLREAKRFP
ncbi:hypothetical protein DTO166G4_8499 [Paecilomyces variotii]|nr:hypothetical protein DTO032I3_2179 [Paecilomyces variotii]KAJ9209886.1 hypothetical protein DTO166G4_8499 [Paecilomyces variotii]KAJ9229117.1 hypothetical protein DTO166G5_8123 [Paecilomyces variotii]KAJ9280801.1 hypothetical protein DTO021D3_2271 [Paecilomyces variotii]KAJ9289177.1 hypothetical protein DTO021C3_3369 [Paecilomyces variotii]